MRKLRFRKLSNLPKIRQKLRINCILLHVHALLKGGDCYQEEDMWTVFIPKALIFNSLPQKIFS